MALLDRLWPETSPHKLYGKVRRWPQLDDDDGDVFDEHLSSGKLYTSLTELVGSAHHKNACDAIEIEVQVVENGK